MAAAETVAWVKPPEPIRGLDHLGVLEGGRDDQFVAVLFEEVQELRCDGRST